ncbi:putative Antitoxin VapB27 [Candidatus Sulfopaludibacter sp. SbA3]|nr:putative Antitoxin VapB27 [Candidatus Sulfopaludibacter sp. SbA3]
MELVIDKAGRIVIPKPIRDALRLDAGDVIELEQEGETLHLRPRRSGSNIRKKQGIWVYRSNSKTAPVDIVALIDQLREERIQELMK